MKRNPKSANPNPEHESSFSVGYKCPPKSTQFPKGRSGNIHGRPKGSKNFKTDLKEELDQLVRVKEGNQIAVITKRKAILKRAVEKALQGDMRATDLIIKWMAQYLGVEEGETQPRRLPLADQAILNRFVNQRIKTLQKSPHQGGQA